MSNAIARRDLLLYELYEQNAIDMTLLSELMAEEIVLSPGETTKNNYVDTYIRYCATIELMENSGFILRYNFNSKEEEELYYKDYAEAYSYCNSLLFTGDAGVEAGQKLPEPQHWVDLGRRRGAQLQL